MNLSEFDLSVLYGAAHTVPDNETCIVLNENPAFIFKCDKWCTFILLTTSLPELPPLLDGAALSLFASHTFPSAPLLWLHFRGHRRIRMTEVQIRKAGNNAQLKAMPQINTNIDSAWQFLMGWRLNSIHTYDSLAPEAAPVLQSPHAATVLITHHTFGADGQIAFQPLVGHGHLEGKINKQSISNEALLL